MIARSPAPLLLLLLGACRVDSTVGYNEGAGALVGGTRCGDDGLARCSDGACAIENLFDAPGGSVTLSVDETDIFFLTSPVGIGKRALDGSSNVALAHSDSTLMRMAGDATHVYWTELDGDVRGVAKTGGARFDASYVFGNPTDITLDSTHLYWIFPEFGQVAQAPKPRGPSTYITGQASPAAITTDATHVYWVNAGSGAMTGELVRAVRGDLTSAEVVLSGLDAPVAIAASDDAVYFASKTALYRWPKGENAAQTIATGFSEVKAIGVYGGTAYGVGMEGLWLVAVTGGQWQALERRPMSAMAMTCAGVYATAWFENAFVKYGP